MTAHFFTHAARAGNGFGSDWITLAFPPRFSICMVLVCNWDDPSSADVDHILDFFVYFHRFIFNKRWLGYADIYHFAQLTPHSSAVHAVSLSMVWRLSGVMAYS